jgi:hypothetical protein
MRIATGEEPEDYGPESGKDKAAQELGRKGGKKRAESITPERRGDCEEDTLASTLTSVFQSIYWLKFGSEAS